MIYILDTDILTFLLREESAQRACVEEKILELPDEDIILTTIINYEEQVRGWMSFLAQTRSATEEIHAYERLSKQLEFFKKLTMLAYDMSAARIFADLRKHRIRIGSMDLKIAAIALASNGTLITWNTVDFQRVPDLRIADWSFE